MDISLTIVIKTFNRLQSLSDLLNSIRKLKFPYPIIIADDGEHSNEMAIKKEFSDLPITYLNLPFDTGLSEGRNVLVNNVKTQYFLLCDDDYIFDKRTDLVRAYISAAQNKLDILGGACFNYVKITSFAMFLKQLNHPFRITRFIFNQSKISRYLGNFKITGDTCELLVTNKRPKDSPYVCDLVSNFFIAQTSSIKKMGGWDKSLKMGEHEDFFLRAKEQGLKVAFLNDFGTKHYPFIPVKNSAYDNYRVRAAFYKSLFVKKHNFKFYVEKNIDTDKVLFEFDNKEVSNTNNTH